ncbi:hypothetical protein J25TS5_19660 [Paenibacillus faecis]|uniref:methyltransferase domain-containing protein n=1 Tax=Paenibacillus faecis TaxID=862114 RepID=UPI001B2D8A93|nr:methyltransferase domain-containing protein [Paenibacillus faecis]GIO85034.1 hypothetical protein J25TS5_19660 [Paenibacillus faecis]
MEADHVQDRAALSGKLISVLNSRSLERTHPRLAGMLTPGLSVLDVGCGTGAITRGIAEAVGPSGHVVGIDSNPQLIEQARQMHGSVPNLTFQVGDVYHLDYKEAFDLVTCARLLVWLSDPMGALMSMKDAAKKGGRLHVADYNHEKISWDPQPPASMLIFYAAYLKWRSDAGLDNTIADRLPELFSDAGLSEVQVHPQHESITRTDEDFASRIRIWADTASSRGPQMERDGYISASEYRKAEEEYRMWSEREADKMQMYMLAVEGVKTN